MKVVMSSRRSGNGRNLAWLAGGVLSTGLVAVVLRALPAVSPTTVALLLLLLVLATATAAGLWVSVVLSFVAMLTLNFFFLPPVGTFRIADVQNWVALVVFLAVAVSARQLPRSRRHARLKLPPAKPSSRPNGPKRNWRDAGRTSRPPCSRQSDTTCAHR
jgi:K+-sensing histidine kinase KdpD